MGWGALSSFTSGSPASSFPPLSRKRDRLGRGTIPLAWSPSVALPKPWAAFAPGLGRRGSAEAWPPGRTALGDLPHQLGAHGAGEVAPVLGPQDEGAGAADHVALEHRGEAAI